MALIKKLQAMVSAHTTYQVGLLQNRAFRALKSHTNDALEPLGISATDWGLLGLLYDAKSGMRLGDAAREMSVEAPLVSVMFAALAKKNLVETRKDEADSRAKILVLTKEGRAFVPKTEKYLRHQMRHLLSGASPSEILGYIVVLQKIIDNTK